MCREWKTLTHSALKGLCLSHSPHQESGIYREEKAERLQDSVRVDNCTETAFSRQDRGTCEFTETVTTCTRPAQVRMGKWTQSPTPNLRSHVLLIAAGRRRAHFFSGVILIYQPHSRGSPVLRRTQNKLHEAGDFDLFGWFRCKTIFFLSFFFFGNHGYIFTGDGDSFWR